MTNQILSLNYQLPHAKNALVITQIQHFSHVLNTKMNIMIPQIKRNSQLQINNSYPHDKNKNNLTITDNSIDMIGKR